MPTPELIEGGGVLTLVLVALTAFFKWGLPALRNGKHQNGSGYNLGDIKESLDEIQKSLDGLPKDVVAEVRDALASTVAQIDLAAREREIARREDEQRKRA